MRPVLITIVVSTTFAVLGWAEPFEIGPERPLILVPAPGQDAPDGLAHADAVVRAWDAAPEELRERFAFVVDTPVTRTTFYADRFSDVLTDLGYRDVPIVAHASAGTPATSASVETLREWLEAYPAIRGVYASGFAFDAYPPHADDPIWTPGAYRWIADAFAATVESGRTFFLELGGAHWTRFLAHPASESVIEAFRRYPEQAVVLSDARGDGQLARVGALTGLWYEGAAGHWGTTVTAEAYTAAHFLAPGISGVNANPASMPAPLYRAFLLAAASGGATVYRVPETQPLWYGESAAVWDTVLEPTIGEIVSRRAIPRKDWLTRDARVAYRLSTAATPQEYRTNALDIDGVVSEGILIHGAYGMDRPGQTPEYIPDTGRYGWIPILRPGAPDEVLELFAEVVLPGAMLDARAWTDRLNQHYPPTAEGEAYVNRAGRMWFVLHSRENDYAPQQFMIPDLPTPVRNIVAERVPEGIRVSWPFREGDLSYTVLRRLPGEADFTAIARDVDRREFVDAGFGDPDAVFYAVTTLTQDNEPLIGLVNFGDYRMYSTVESRVEESVELRRFETRAVSRPLPDPPLDERNTVTLRSDPFADLRPIDRQRLARMAEDAVQRMQRAFRERDAAALTALYADDYADALGKTRETVRTAFELFFSRFRPGPVHWQARDAQIDADGNVELTGYLRFTGFAYDHPGEAVADRAVEFPLGPSREVTLTFRPSGSAESAQGGLSIVRTDPPLPNLNDLFGRAAVVAAEPSL